MWLVVLGACGGGGDTGGDGIFFEAGEGWGPYGGFSVAHALFLESASNAPTQGQARLLLTDGDPDCTRVAEAGSDMGALSLLFADTHGVFATLSYQYSTPSLAGTEPLVGLYGGGGIRTYDFDGLTQTSLAATAQWFDDEGRWLTDDAGLFIEIEDANASEVTGFFRHYWEVTEFTAERCGYY